MSDATEQGPSAASSRGAAPARRPNGWDTSTYRALRAIAHRQLAAERPDHTLDSGAVVHEAWLRLAAQRATPLDRAHFLALAARTMRRVLVDHARRHRASRRGGPARLAIGLDVLDAAAPALTSDTRSALLLALDEALDRLGALQPRLAAVVECRFFAGLTEDETAQALGVSTRTVARDWLAARAWLRGALRDDDA